MAGELPAAAIWRIVTGPNPRARNSAGRVEQGLADGRITPDRAAGPACRQRTAEGPWSGGILIVDD
jgi:hypothetical protein